MLFEALRLFEFPKRDEILASKRMQNLPFNRTFLSYPTPLPYIVLPAWIGSYFILSVHAQSSFYSPLKPRPNDCNISTQSISQHCCRGATCCVHLATLWRRVATCCDMLGIVSSNLKMVKFSMQHLWMLHDVVVVWPGSCNNVSTRHAH